MSRYTPNTDKVLEAYTAHGHLIDDERYRARGLSILQDEIYREEFDRWLNQVRADAIREVADAWAVREGVSWFTPFASSVNWLNEYADKIEKRVSK